jgi:hypothetical protein
MRLPLRSSCDSPAGLTDVALHASAPNLHNSPAGDTHRTAIIARGAIVRHAGGFDEGRSRIGDKQRPILAIRSIQREMPHYCLPAARAVDREAGCIQPKSVDRHAVAGGAIQVHILAGDDDRLGIDAG